MDRIFDISLCQVVSSRLVSAVPPFTPLVWELPTSIAEFLSCFDVHVQQDREKRSLACFLHSTKSIFTRVQLVYITQERFCFGTKIVPRASERVNYSFHDTFIEKCFHDKVRALVRQRQTCAQDEQNNRTVYRTVPLILPSPSL